MNSKKAKKAGFFATLALVSVVAFSPSPASAQTATAPQSVKDGIASAIATVEELDGLALAALAVALTPMGAMLTLRFLNMVLSRV